VAAEEAGIGREMISTFPHSAAKNTGGKTAGVTKKLERRNAGGLCRRCFFL